MWNLSLRHAGFSLVELLSSCSVQAPEHASSIAVSCRLSCPVACGILVPHPGIEPACPALEGGFLTIEPQGSPSEPEEPLKQGSWSLKSEQAACQGV